MTMLGSAWKLRAGVTGVVGAWRLGYELLN
jgi:hypothetical protein